MNEDISKVLLAAATLALVAGCADLHEQFIASAGGSTANGGATAPLLRPPYAPSSPQPALAN